MPVLAQTSTNTNLSPHQIGRQKGEGVSERPHRVGLDLVFVSTTANRDSNRLQNRLFPHEILVSRVTCSFSAKKQKCFSIFERRRFTSCPKNHSLFYLQKNEGQNRVKTTYKCEERRRHWREPRRKEGDLC